MLQASVHVSDRTTVIATPADQVSTVPETESARPASPPQQLARSGLNLISETRLPANNWILLDVDLTIICTGIAEDGGNKIIYNDRLIEDIKIFVKNHPNTKIFLFTRCSLGLPIKSLPNNPEDLTTINILRYKVWEYLENQELRVDGMFVWASPYFEQKYEMPFGDFGKIIIDAEKKIHSFFRANPRILGIPDLSFKVGSSTLSLANIYTYEQQYIQYVAEHEEYKPKYFMLKHIIKNLLNTVNRVIVIDDSFFITNSLDALNNEKLIEFRNTNVPQTTSTPQVNFLRVICLKEKITINNELRVDYKFPNVIYDIDANQVIPLDQTTNGSETCYKARSIPHHAHLSSRELHRRRTMPPQFANSNYNDDSDPDSDLGSNLKLLNELRFSLP